VDKAQVMEKQTQILRDIFDSPELEVTEETSANDVDGWDSITHMQVIATLEKEFKIRFALGELQSLKNVGEMASLILKKI
tara:strand:- start:90685 stop:90924 length:240 start_codon:yes stop_codon:yes gene_type:complete